MIRINWTREEIILALDLYIKEGYLYPGHPKIIALSNELQKLPIHIGKEKPSTFRNPNGVSKKLGNFQRFDPNHDGVGLWAGSKVDEEVWNDFANAPEKLEAEAKLIREIYLNNDFTILIELDDDEYGIDEGQYLVKYHKLRERNQPIINKKKNQFQRLHGRLYCEICGFDFEKQYLEIKKPFIECHHLTPLSQIVVGKKTKLSDLILLCSNCHRMIHRTVNFDINTLKKSIQILF